MFRRMYFVAAVPALLVLLTASAVQARPITVSAPSEGILAKAWQLLSQHWPGTWIKEGVGMDPNGGTPHNSVVPPRHTGAYLHRRPIDS